MTEKVTGMERGRGHLAGIEAGQVAEIRMPGRPADYWTYIKGVSGTTVEVWLPETNGETITLSKGTEVELCVTIASDEILVARGRVLEADGSAKPCAELELDPACVSIEHKRRYLRIPASVPATVQRLPDGLIPSGEPVAARTISLSPGGLALEAQGGFSQGEEVAVALSLPGCRAEAIGSVLEVSERPGGASRFSVMFTYISDCSEAAITRTIYQYQRMHGAARS